MLDDVSFIRDENGLDGSEPTASAVAGPPHEGEILDAYSRAVIGAVELVGSRRGAYPGGGRAAGASPIANPLVALPGAAAAPASSWRPMG